MKRIKKFEQLFESFDGEAMYHSGAVSGTYARMMDYNNQNPAIELEEEMGELESNVMVDSDGNPRIFYHATDTKFETFDTKYQLNGWLGKGFYFADNLEVAKEYGKYVKKVYLNMTNPFYVEGNAPSDAYTEINKKYNPDKMRNDELSILLKENFHDGVIFKHWDKGYIYSCFYPNQVEIIK